MILVLFFIAGGVAGTCLVMQGQLCYDRREAIRLVGLRKAIAPASHCDHCRRPLPGRHVLPMVSWLALEGRSGCCDKPLRRRYIVGELIGFFGGGVVLLAALSLLQ